MKSQETIFDKIIAGQIPAEILYEDEFALAFWDINPQAPVHVLVIPKKKVASFDCLPQWTNEETGAFFLSVHKVIRQLGLRDGYRLVLNNGRYGQQSVDYLHVHILSGRQMSWPPG
jgi:histidine triad (HIT) family protein